MYENAVAWLDLPDLDSKLPTFKDKIMIKASRISWESNRDKPYGHYKLNTKNGNPQNEPESVPESKPIVQLNIPSNPTPPQNKAKEDLLGDLLLDEPKSKKI